MESYQDQFKYEYVEERESICNNQLNSFMKSMDNGKRIETRLKIRASCNCAIIDKARMRGYSERKPGE